MLVKSNPKQAKIYFDQAQKDVNERFERYQYLAARDFTDEK
jgi:hypothetical protein